jgi:hypothetical protein
VDGARITIVLTGYALIQGPDDVIAMRCSARLRCFITLGIGLLNERGDIGRAQGLLRQGLRELLMHEDERGWSSEDGDCYEAMADFLHRRTSDLCG